MRKSLPIHGVKAEISACARVLLHAGPAESLALQHVLRADPDCLARATLTGLFIPGVNSFDYASLTPTTRIETPFLPPALRGGFEAGRIDFLPMHYSHYPSFLARHPADLAILHLPPPRDGVFSCGIGADIADGIARFARRIIVLVNPAMPYTHGATALRVDEADAIFDADGALLRFPAEAETETGVMAKLAGQVAALIDDGDTLQFGIGRVQASVLHALRSHRALRIHSGLILDEVAVLTEHGAIASPKDGAPSIVTGIALGSDPVLELAAGAMVEFHGVGVTHDMRRLASIERFTAINSAVEVDLLGQVNCESVHGRQISGIGGASDFMRAARLSQGGRGIIALPSQNRGMSRIVPELAAGTVSMGRSDIDILATEHGSARLSDLSLDARAEAIIGLAAPEHRAMLANAWRGLRARM